MEHALCKRDSVVAQIAPSDRWLREQHDQEDQRGRERGFHRSHSHGKARGRRAQFSWLEYEGVSNSYPSVELGRFIATSVIALCNDVSVDSSSDSVALRRGLLAFADSVEAKHERF